MNVRTRVKGRALSSPPLPVHSAMEGLPEGLAERLIELIVLTPPPALHSAHYTITLFV